MFSSPVRSKTNKHQKNVRSFFAGVKDYKDNFEIKMAVLRQKNSILCATIISSLRNYNNLTNIKIFRIQQKLTLSTAEDTVQVFRLSSSTFVFTRAF